MPAEEGSKLFMRVHVCAEEHLDCGEMTTSISCFKHNAENLKEILCAFVPLPYSLVFLLSFLTSIWLHILGDLVTADLVLVKQNKSFTFCTHELYKLFTFSFSCQFNIL